MLQMGNIKRERDVIYTKRLFPVLQLRPGSACSKAKSPHLNQDTGKSSTHLSWHPGLILSMEVDCKMGSWSWLEPRYMGKG